MTRQRQPRLHCPAFLAFVRTHPCCVCHRAPPVQAAHLRMGDLDRGKRPAGIAEKPSDRWCTPLCERCHLSGPKAQHSMGEAEFWRMHGLDPFAIAEALWTKFMEQSPGAAVSDKPKTRQKMVTRSKKWPAQKIPQRKNPWPPKGSRPFQR